MQEMTKTLNVIEATNKVGLIENLFDLQKELTICEKALAEYLETKRLAFPRFYFVSSADLLDILSNGNNPELVTRLVLLPWNLNSRYESIVNAISISKISLQAFDQIIRFDGFTKIYEQSRWT